MKRKKTKVVKQQALKSVDDIKSIKTIRNFLITNVLVTLALFVFGVIAWMLNNEIGLDGANGAQYALYAISGFVFIFGTISMLVIGILTLIIQRKLKQFNGIVIASGCLAISCILFFLSIFVWLPTFVVSLIALILIQKNLKK